MAGGIENPYWIARALASAASALAEVDVDRAMAVARRHREPNGKRSTLASVAGALATLDVDRALAVAEKAVAVAVVLEPAQVDLKALRILQMRSDHLMWLILRLK